MLATAGFEVSDHKGRSIYKIVSVERIHIIQSGFLVSGLLRNTLFEDE